MNKLLRRIIRLPWILGTEVVLLWNRTRAGRTLITTTYDLYPPGLPAAFDGCTIVHLTDLHGRVFGPEQADLLHHVRALAPDLILLTGDMYDEEQDPERRAEINGLMEELAKDAPVYASMGNHEIRSDELLEIETEMRRTGVRLLRDRSAIVTHGTDKIGITGLDPNPQEGMLEEEAPEVRWDRLQKAMARFAEEPVDFKILLAHKPELLEDYAMFGADLVFSGHAHGGLLELPLLHKRLLAPGQGLFPRYSQGLYLQDHTLLVLSSGLGGPRLGLKPEIVQVRLHVRKRPSTKNKQ